MTRYVTTHILDKARIIDSDFDSIEPIRLINGKIEPTPDSWDNRYEYFGPLVSNSSTPNIGKVIRGRFHMSDRFYVPEWKRKEDELRLNEEFIMPAKPRKRIYAPDIKCDLCGKQPFNTPDPLLAHFLKECRCGKYVHK